MKSALCGILAEFDKPEEICLAAKRAAEEGYRNLEGFTPYHVEGLAESLGFHRTGVAPCVFAGGITGAITAYALEYYCNAVNFPINVAGRPLNSIPSFIPVTFELTILFASFSALFGMFFLNGLPRLWRPIWGVEQFRRATKDGFFLLIEARDPKFDRDGTKLFLESTGAKGVYEVQA